MELRIIRLSVAVIFCVLVSACARETPAPKPAFKGRLLLLSGEAASEKDLLEMSAGPNDTFDYKTITSGILEAAANPEQTQIIYATQSEILLRDLQSGEARTLIKGTGFCLAWSPDGKHFSYKQAGPKSNKLFASDLEGHTKQVSDETADTNECAYWVAPDKLIFDRYGPSQKRGPDVKPNTTTLATVSDSVKLVDTEKKWSVEGICKSGSAFLRSLEGAILIAKGLENPKTANPTSGPCAGCRFVGFAAQSCVPFFIEENSRDSSDLFYLNPTNWQRQRSAHIGQAFSPNARMLINSSTRYMVVGDAPASLWLINTESGDMTSLVNKTVSLKSPAPVVWIEK